MANFNPEEIKYLEEQIKKTISSIETDSFQWSMRNEINTLNENEGNYQWLEDWIKIRIRDLYNCIIAYFEAKCMIQYLATFKENFYLSIEDDKKILKTEHLDSEGEPEFLIISEFKKFLYPFRFFDFKKTREDEIIKLTRILNNTDYIVKNCNADIYKESDIYKQVKWVLGLYYPTCRPINMASFIKQFKSYKPDILIPELNTSIEYKYVKSSSDNLDEYIDQIKVDASNYTGDSNYENFVAVIYLQDTSVATPENIKTAWMEKKFPNNWKLVIVNGSPTSKKSKSLK